VGSLVLSRMGEGKVIEIDGLLAGLAASGPALEDRLQQQHGLFEGETVSGAKVGTGAPG
jgi:hypothetical protein